MGGATRLINPYYGKNWRVKMKYKIEKLVLCEVSIWNVIEADSMEEAMGNAAYGGSGDENYDHEIVSDVRTILVRVKEMME